MNPEAPQKLTDFNAELKTLCDKYLYELKATLQIAPDSSAIVATIQVFDKSPKNEGVTLPTMETATETIESPAAADPVDTGLPN